MRQLKASPVALLWSAKKTAAGRACHVLILTVFLALLGLALGNSLAVQITIIAPVHDGSYSSLSTATGTAYASDGVAGVYAGIQREVAGEPEYWDWDSRAWTKPLNFSRHTRQTRGTTRWALRLPSLAAGQYSLFAKAQDSKGRWNEEYVSHDFSIEGRAAVDSRATAPVGTRATVVVTTTADTIANDGETSLREAINFANTSSGTTISFNIPSTDPNFDLTAFTIKPLTALPGR